MWPFWDLSKPVGWRLLSLAPARYRLARQTELVMKRLFQLALAAAALTCTTWRMTGNDGAPAPAAESRDPERAFRKACEQLVALEHTHVLLKGVSEAKPVLEQDEKERLKSVSLV